jgi:hypothetical protein
MATTTESAETETWEDILMDTQVTEDDLFSDTSYQEAIQVLQVWQQEEADDDAPMEDDDDDVIMQLEADEGLLPSLHDFYDSISADTCPPEELLSDAVISEESSSSTTTNNDSSDSFLVEEQQEPNEKTRVFEETLRKLTESMKRSQKTRQSLYAKTPKLRDYKRVGSVEKVLRSIEFSSYQIDSYCKSVRATTL